MVQPVRARAHEMATERAESFSDGVFAVAVTLLVLDLGAYHVRPGRLTTALGHEWPHS
jgi:TMEM175 potassium channel family protein